MKAWCLLGIQLLGVFVLLFVFRFLPATLGLALASANISPVIAEDEFTAPLTALGTGAIKQFAADPALLEAVKAHNAISAGYDQARIDALDQQWRAEIDASSKPLIDATLNNAASAYLAAVQEESAGLYTEIFAMDARGLNVAQSTLTSDYWQGDEDKWQQTFLVGPDAVQISEVEQDESTQVFQSQVSVAITDPASGEVVGAVTVGVDLSML